MPVEEKREQEIMDEFYEREAEVDHLTATREIARALVAAEFEAKDARDRIEELEGALPEAERLLRDAAEAWPTPNRYTAFADELAALITASEASPREEQPDAE